MNLNKIFKIILTIIITFSITACNSGYETTKKERELYTINAWVDDNPKYDDNQKFALINSENHTINDETWNCMRTYYLLSSDLQRESFNQKYIVTSSETAQYDISFFSDGYLFTIEKGTILLFVKENNEKVN